MAKMTPAEFRESQENQSTVNSAYEKAKADFYAFKKKSKFYTDENGLPPDDPDCDFQNCL